MSSSTQNTKIPDPQFLLLKEPLYHPHTITIDNFESVVELYYFNGKIDCYCTKCEKERIFEIVNPVNPEVKIEAGIFVPSEEIRINNAYNRVLFFGTFYRKFRCSLDDSHIIEFFFTVKENKLIKIGQYPSGPDLSAGENKEYRKILGAQYAEYNRAKGLFAFGVGVGSFVYLRRIFENIIYETYEQNKTNIAENEFYKLRMDEKIGVLKDYLPVVMVDNKALYSIISKGIHELSEDECIKYFPVILDGIEMILNEKLEKKRQIERAANTSKLLTELHTKLK